MKVNELAIGDWVNFLIEVECDDTEYGQQTAVYEPSKVQQIRTWWLDAEVEGDDVNDIDQLQPIPLTAEILVKNGFQQISTNKYVSGKVTIAIFAEEFLIAIKSENARVMITIKYIHELQHALRLCNIEKTIEL